MSIGLRPAVTGVGLHAPIALENGTDPRVSPQSVPPLQAVNGETQQAVLDLFQQTKKKATVIIMLDTSPSMAGEKLKSAMDGTFAYIHRLAKDDEITLFLFNDKTIQVGSSGRVGDEAEELEQKLRESNTFSKTALYQSICEAVYFTSELKSAKEQDGVEKRLYGVVVLTDGEDTSSKITLHELISTYLPTGEDVEGIKIYTIAYGADADQEVLKQIAEQTNGKFLVGDRKIIQAIYLALSAEP